MDPIPYFFRDAPEPEAYGKLFIDTCRALATQLQSSSKEFKLEPMTGPYPAGQMLSMMLAPKYKGAASGVVQCCIYADHNFTGALARPIKPCEEPWRTALEKSMPTGSLEVDWKYKIFDQDTVQIQVQQMVGVVKHHIVGEAAGYVIQWQFVFTPPYKVEEVVESYGKAEAERIERRIAEAAAEWNEGELKFDDMIGVD